MQPPMAGRYEVLTAPAPEGGAGVAEAHEQQPVSVHDEADAWQPWHPATSGAS